MERVQGLGGIFFKSPDPKALARWYADNLGVELEPWGGAVFRWSAQADAETAATVWNPFPADTKYFEPSERGFMFNFRVQDLEAMLAQIAAGGGTVLEARESSDELGKFGWFVDPDGNKVELWQPPAGGPTA